MTNSIMNSSSSQKIRFAYVPVTLFPKGVFSTADKLVYIFLCSHSNPNGESCFPSIRTLAEETELSPFTVQKAIKNLEANKWIVKTNRSGQKSNTYKIIYNINAVKKINSGEGVPVDKEGVPVSGTRVPVSGTEQYHITIPINQNISSKPLRSPAKNPENPAAKSSCEDQGIPREDGLKKNIQTEQENKIDDTMQLHESNTSGKGFGESKLREGDCEMKYKLEVTFVQIAKAWNREMVPKGFRKIVISKNEKRRQGFLNARVRDFPKIGTRRFWEVFFEEVAKSDFLSGRIKPGKGHEGWRATLTWFLENQSAMTKLMEGQYANRDSADDGQLHFFEIDESEEENGKIKTDEKDEGLENG